MVQNGAAVEPPPAAGGERKKRSRWGTKEEPGEGGAAPGGEEGGEVKRQRKSKVRFTPDASRFRVAACSPRGALIACARLPLLCGTCMLCGKPPGSADAAPPFAKIASASSPAISHPRAIAVCTVGCRNAGSAGRSSESERREPHQ